MSSSASSSFFLSVCVVCQFMEQIDSTKSKDYPVNQDKKLDRFYTTILRIGSAFLM